MSEPAEIAKRLAVEHADAIRAAEPWGDRWWLPYTKGEERLERLNVFRFGSAQFTDLGLAVRRHLLENGNV